MESICCYILRCSDGTLYTGWTTNIARRLQEHNAGRGGRYTRSRRPVELIYLEPQIDARAARLREITLKKLKRSEKLKLAQQEIGSRIEPPPQEQEKSPPSRGSIGPRAERKRFSACGLRRS